MKLVSLTAVLKVRGPIDLKKYKTIKKGNKKGRRFFASKLKLEDGGCALLFRNGKVVIVGNIHVDKATIQILHTTRKVLLDLPVIRNQVYSGHLNKRLNLVQTCNKLQQSGLFIAWLEPERFPSLFASRINEKGTIQLCLSGVYIITGIVNLEEAEKLLVLTLKYILYHIPFEK